jgi:hypothetical protein
MRISKILALFLPLVLAHSAVLAQISPGDLTSAHAELEGMLNCTKCHDLGDKVSNTKCLDCHKEIKSRINKKQGYHASSQVRKKDCFDCHSEHHGRKFEMVRLDKESFNHDWTGYKLTGSHKQVDCRECHQPDNIQESKYKSDKNTFLGLGQDCNMCHEDVHQNTLSQKCTDCHDTKKFAPASNFNHSKTDFALRGKHAQVDCIECHKKGSRNGKEFQFFSDVNHNNCTDCHDDPHLGELGTSCTSCHTESGWDNFIGRGRFNHNQTGFPLKGKHQSVDCRECHSLERGPTTVFRDRSGVRTNECATCHDDVHEGKFGSDCAECHTEKGFRGSANLGEFNHDRTDFALRGKHEAVDCKECHKGSMLDPLPFNTCLSCHDDFHEGQFVENGNTQDCSSCHDVSGFEGSTFGFDRHAATKFPLEGGHMATPCFECHLADDGKWKFKDIGQRCNDCHKDVHAGTLPEKYYPQKDCASCHITDSWLQNQFDHTATAFQLEGIHSTTQCSECHKRDAEFEYGKFTGISSTCIDCHDDIHKGQFADQWGKIDCKRCHAFENWDAVNFDHSRTKFQLEGRHAEIECSACHKPDTTSTSDVVVYKIEQFECINCHQ